MIEEGSSAVQHVANKVRRLADAYVAKYCRRFPVKAEFSGVAMDRHDTLPDNSLTALDHWHALEDGWSAAIETIDPCGNASGASSCRMKKTPSATCADERATVEVVSRGAAIAPTTE